MSANIISLADFKAQSSSRKGMKEMMYSDFTAGMIA